MGDKDEGIKWPSAFVAGVLILFVGAVIIAAIVRYPTVEEALKIWGMLGSVVGLLTGTFVTYFFTRASVTAATNTAFAERQKAETARKALTTVAGFVEPGAWQRLLREAPDVRGALIVPV